MELNRKSKPRYLGPMIVVKRTEKGAYVLAELDRAVAKTSYAAFRLVPYLARKECTGPIPQQPKSYISGEPGGDDEAEGGAEEPDAVVGDGSLTEGTDADDWGELW